MSAILARCSQPGDTMRGSMANLALYSGAENVASLYASLLQLTMILTMMIRRLGHARFVAANYMVKARVCCGANDQTISLVPTKQWANLVVSGPIKGVWSLRKKHS